MKYFPTANFSRMTDADLIIKGEEVATGLDANPNFAETPPTTMIDLSAQTFKFLRSKATMKRKSGTTGTDEKNADRKVLIAMLDGLKSYVRINCKNDKEIILSSGFEASKEATESIAPLRVEGLSYVYDQKTNKFEFIWDNASNVDTYIIETQIVDDSAEWKLHETTKESKIYLEFNERGVEFGIRIIGTNSKGKGPESDAIYFFGV